jgi:hypothetical protein
VVKIATVLEEYSTEERHSVVRFFCGQKDSMQRIFIKKCFLFTVGSVCGVKRFHLGGKRFADDEEVETEVRKWRRQQSKDFYAACSAMGQVYQSSWRICREINVFYRFEYHMFYVIYPFMTYLLTPPRNMNKSVEAKQTRKTHRPVECLHCFEHSPAISTCLFSSSLNIAQYVVIVTV